MGCSSLGSGDSLAVRVKTVFEEEGFINCHERYSSLMDEGVDEKTCRDMFNVLAGTERGRRSDPKGRGVITDEERNGLVAKGYSAETVAELAGEDGRNMRNARITWLANDIDTWCYRDKCNWRKLDSVEALRSIGPDAVEAVPTLVEIFNDNDPSSDHVEDNLHYEAGRALAMIGGDEAVEALKTAIKKYNNVEAGAGDGDIYDFKGYFNFEAPGIADLAIWMIDNTSNCQDVLLDMFGENYELLTREQKDSVIAFFDSVVYDEKWRGRLDYRAVENLGPKAKNDPILYSHLKAVANNHPNKTLRLNAKVFLIAGLQEEDVKLATDTLIGIFTDWRSFYSHRELALRSLNEVSGKEIGEQLKPLVPYIEGLFNYGNLTDNEQKNAVRILADLDPWRFAKYTVDRGVFYGGVTSQEWQDISQALALGFIRGR